MSALKADDLRAVLLNVDRLDDGCSAEDQCYATEPLARWTQERESDVSRLRSNRQDALLIDQVNNVGPTFVMEASYLLPRQRLQAASL